jgi:hypothetical protein
VLPTAFLALGAGAALTGGAAALIGLQGSMVARGGDLVQLGEGATLSTGGSILETAEAGVAFAGALARVMGGATLLAGNPAIRMTGGWLSADSVLDSDGTGNTVTINGSVLDVTDGRVVLGAFTNVPAPSEDMTTLALGVNQPVVNLTSSSLTLTGTDHVVKLNVGETEPLTQSGVAVIASGTALARKDWRIFCWTKSKVRRRCCGKK